MPAGLEPVARRLDADHLHLAVVEERVEEPDRVAAAADAGDQHVGQPAGRVLDLAPRLLADHRLEVAHDHRIGMRARDRADDVEGVAHVGDPVAHRLVDRVLQRAAARLDGVHGRAEELHAEDVQRLAPHVLAAHEDLAAQAEERRGGRRRHAVLAGAGLGDDARLAHALARAGSGRACC